MSSISNNIDMIKQYLDVRVAQHGVHSSNIANAETPNFKRINPHFEAKLKNQMGDQDILSSVSDRKWDLGLRIDKSQALGREDGNNVDLEQEMSAMAENSMMYMTALKIFTKETAIARYAITSGGR